MIPVSSLRFPGPRTMSSNISYHTGDIFSSDAGILVCPVNCVGVMGGGLAKTFAEKVPYLEEDYKRMCKEERLRIGTIIIWQGWWEKAVLLFPTKRHYQEMSKLWYISDGLMTMMEDWYAATALMRDNKSVAFPRLGCGLGGLNWTNVRPVMEERLKRLPTKVQIWLPTPEE